MKISSRNVSLFSQQLSCLNGGHGLMDMVVMAALDDFRGLLSLPSSTILNYT